MDLSFMNSTAATIVGLLVILGGGMFVVLRVMKGREGTGSNQPNTGEPWTPGKNKPPVDNRPKPKPPPKNEV